MTAQRRQRQITRLSARKGRAVRCGAALVEFVVALPFLMLLLLATLDASNLMFLKNSLRTAAHEAIRRAASDDLTTEQAAAIARRYLADLSVDEAQIETEPAELSSAITGRTLQLTIRVPSSSQALFMNSVLSDLEISASAAVVK